MQKISIIVPVYNVASYLSECINSLLNQTYKNFEIILVDDGSNDDSGMICDDYDSKYNNIKVVHQENAGLPAARNAGLKVATGEYIGFIDSDDYIDKDMYRILVEKIIETNADMAICNFQTFNCLGKNPIVKRYVDETITYSDTKCVDFYKCCLDSSCNRIYKADIIRKENIWFEDKKIVAQEDFWFLTRYLTFAKKIVTCENSLYLYRERASSISKTRSDNDITDRCIDFMHKTEEFIREYSERNIEEFLKYQSINLFFSAINNSQGYKIKDIVLKFMNNTNFNKAISSENILTIYPGVSVRMIYNRFLFKLLRMKNFFGFSMLEKIRVKRLCSKNRKDIYFK